MKIIAKKNFVRKGKLINIGDELEVSEFDLAHYKLNQMAEVAPMKTKPATPSKTKPAAPNKKK